MPLGKGCPEGKCVHGFESTGVLLLLGTIQGAGLASACLARLLEGSSHEKWCQRVFFVALTAVGVATMASLASNSAGWIASAATLAFMVITAVLDLRRNDAVARAG